MTMNGFDAPPLGRAATFQAALEHVSRLATLDRPALVIGERGTGKELFAARLHFLSRRWDGPFVRLNCAALAESLLESELFGHEAGAFTGAVKRRLGRFEQAHGGTLFLDEIATASPAVQERLLRAIEYGEIDRVGGGGSVRVDVRVVAATNADLPDLAEKGRFRADLLDRLAFDVVTLPPLRARRDDILLLANHFGLEMTKHMKRDCFNGFSESAEGGLLNHSWPGNVRELRNVVERSVAASTGTGPVETIIFDPFDSPWRPKPLKLPVEDRPPSDASDSGGGGEPFAPSSLPQEGFAEAVRRFERGLLTLALDEARHNQRRAARSLGLTYDQLRGLSRRHGLTGGARDTPGSPRRASDA